jgi:hypothetical protein
MDRPNENDVLLARYHWRELLTNLRQLGFTVKYASFEEREREKEGLTVELIASLGAPE